MLKVVYESFFTAMSQLKQSFLKETFLFLIVYRIILNYKEAFVQP